MRPIRSALCLAFAVQSLPVLADVRADLDRIADRIEPKVIEWRRDIHEHPELGNREVRTAALVADHLKRLGYEVRTGVAKTGIVAVLRGGKPGPVVALRADMDALPVTEDVDLPFASKVRATYGGKETGVMHACGHDTHVAMLMGAAEALAEVRDRIPGTVKLIFQPAEEGPPPGEEGGAALMLKEGAFDAPVPEVVFGLHIGSMLNAGQIGYRPGATLAAADVLKIVVKGKQTHGSAPWGGIDPIVVASQIVLGLQTIVSRQVNIPHEPAVVTIGGIDGGIRFNIIPDKVTMVGTVRTFDEALRDDVHMRIRRTAGNIAEASGATAEVTIDKPYDVTINDPRADGAHAADARARGRRRQRAAARPPDGRGGFLVLRAEGPGAVPLHRRHPGRAGRLEGALQPLAEVLDRRVVAEARRAHAGASHDGLHGREVIDARAIEARRQRIDGGVRVAPRRAVHRRTPDGAGA
jgi:amidohydrolase